MAETVKAPKRRRILDPSVVVSVPIYSNQVSNSLKMRAPAFCEKKSTEEEADADDGFWTNFSRETKPKSPETVTFSDSDEETEPKRAEPPDDTNPLRSPSPPPPESPVQKPSRKAKQKLNEIERRLQAVNSLLSPVDRSRRRRGRRSPRLRVKAPADDVIVLSATEENDDDEPILWGPEPSPLRGPERQIPLKVRCRTDLHKIPVRPSTPLSDVVEQLSVKLGVPPPRLLLLREEAELSSDSTVAALGLGIADILECVVMAEAEKDTPTDTADIIKVRLQGKDRAMELSLRRDAPLGSVFSQYSSGLSVVAQRKVCFHFDGCKLSAQQTPEQLDMEDGDIIEVWA